MSTKFLRGICQMFLLLFISLSLTSASSHSSPFMFPTAGIKATLPQNHNKIPLHKDYYGNYYMRVIWGNKTTSQSNSLADETQTEPQMSGNMDVGKMALSLYSNETFVTRCPNFRVYPCECHCEEQNPRELKLLYQEMNLTGYSMPLDFHTFAFSISNLSVLYAVKCNPSFNNNVHGFLGLGSGENSLLTTLTNFSISLGNSSDDTDSVLIINQEQEAPSSLNNPQDSYFSAVTNRNWAMTMSDLQIVINSQQYQKNLGLNKKYDVIFDLNTDVIGLPVNLYRITTKVLEGYNIFCGENSTTCKCENAFMSDLPVFNLMIEGNRSSTNSISLVPELYFNSSGCELLMKPVSSDKFGMLTVNPSFDGVLILGEVFMKYYETHFLQGENGESFVSIIKGNEGSTVKDLGFWMALSIGGAVVILLLFFIGVTWIALKHEENEVEGKDVKTPLLADKNRENGNNAGKIASSVDETGQAKIYKDEETAVGSVVSN